MSEKEELKYEIKQLKQSMKIMRDIIEKQQNKIMMYDRILTDWISYEREHLDSLTLPTNKE